MTIVLKNNVKRVQLFATTLMFVASVIISSIVLPSGQSAYAIGKGNCDYGFFEDNGVYQYDPCDKCGGVNSAATNTPTFTISDTVDIKSIFLGLTAGGMNSVQAAAVMGNMYQESKLNPDAHEAGNDIGYGLVQWSFGRRTKYEAYAAEKKVAPSDIPTQIAYIFVEYSGSYKSSLIGSDFEKGLDIPKATEAWMKTYEAPALTPANDPAALNTVRIPAALQIYALYKDIGPATALAGAVNTTDCGSGNGIVAGDIVKTALGLALQSPATSYNYPTGSPTGPGTDEATARDTYRAAKTQYNPSVAYSDCGGFIATVMIASGVDTAYPHVGVSTQTAYVQAHPEKYTIINNPSAGDLQPGDILLNNKDGHTTMYVGAVVIKGVSYTDVDASLGQRVPSVRDSGNHTWMIAEGSIVARIKK